MQRVRDLRLIEDYKNLMIVNKTSKMIKINSSLGNPPFEYNIIFNIKGYVNEYGDISDRHECRMILPAGYPLAEPPEFSFSTPILHPNIFVGGTVCTGLGTLVQWNPALFPIEQLVCDIAKYVAFKKDSYNLASIANNWTRQSWTNWISSHKIPCDDREVVFKELPDIKITKKRRPIITIRDSISTRLSHEEVAPVKKINITIRPKND